jgi:uncharacterized protein (TIGR03435 family)
MTQRIFASLALIACTGLAQTAAPAFDVASVKANDSGDGHSHTDSEHGQVRIQNRPLRLLIEMAYNVGEYQLAAPDWLASARYDVIAKAPPEATDEQISAMMQTLLVERFKLTTHRESRPLSVYALTIAKGGPKLHRVEPGNSSTNRTPTSITGRKITMKRLADALSTRLDRPVVDTTGLDGVYDLDLKWAADEGGGGQKPAADAASIFTAIQEQLGLKLEAKKLPVEVLVIDHAEKVPVEN